MILYSDNKNKVIWLIILTALFAGLIFWQWIQFKPELKIEAVENNTFDEIVTESQEYVEAAKDSVEQGAAELQLVQDELQKQEKQAELLDKTRQYLETKE